MVKSEMKRQKKLARKNARAKAKRSYNANQKQRLNSLAGAMEAASRGVILDCFAGVPGSDGEHSGMIPVILRRLGPSGGVAMALFLVDCWCLGVKDCAGYVISRQESDGRLERLAECFAIEPIDPSVARALVEGGVAYAQALGLSPHPAYRKVSLMWGDVPTTRLPRQFEFGFNGRPTYLVGPYDDSHRQSMVLYALLENAGEGNFGFISAKDPFASGIELLGWDELPDDVVDPTINLPEFISKS